MRAPAICRRLLQIDDSEVTFSKRGFTAVSAGVRSHLEAVGASFLTGYRTAVSTDRGGERSLSFEDLEPTYRGFAYEGAAMGLALKDLLLLRAPRRWETFISTSARNHKYVAHVGLGWVIARLPWGKIVLSRLIGRLHFLLRWLVVDGLGFHGGYFNPARWLASTSAPLRQRGYVRRAFDQGLGRSLWFVCGADVDRIARRIGCLSQSRHPDLWSGVGLACCYAGCMGSTDLATLKSRAGVHVYHLAQGVAFGAEARQLASIQVSSSDLACRVICGLDAVEASILAQKTCCNVIDEATSDRPSYEVWRANLRRALEEVAGERISEC
jgi:hypothetical protein